MIVKSMNTRKNRKAPRRAQTTLEYIIIVAVVAIAAIIAAALYMKSTSGSTVGTSTQILAMGQDTSTNTIVMAFSKVLPSVSSGTTVTVTAGGTTYTLNSAVAYATSVDNYPEYTATLSNDIVSDAVDSFQIGTTSILPASNITVQSVSGNVVQP